MTDPQQPIEAMWTDAVRQHLAAMPPAELDALIAQVRPSETDTPTTTDDTDDAIRAAEQAGDWSRAIALKTAKITEIRRNKP